MGWVSSPPNFCACTETIANLVNDALVNPLGVAKAGHLSYRINVVSESLPVSINHAAPPVYLYIRLSHPFPLGSLSATGISMLTIFVASYKATAGPAEWSSVFYSVPSTKSSDPWMLWTLVFATNQLLSRSSSKVMPVGPPSRLFWDSSSTLSTRPFRCRIFLMPSPRNNMSFLPRIGTA